MYGGIMFPGVSMEKTPKNLLFKIRKTGRGKPEARDCGFESQPTSVRTNSTGSNSSTISSKFTVSESVQYKSTNWARNVTNYVLVCTDLSLSAVMWWCIINWNNYISGFTAFSETPSPTQSDDSDDSDDSGDDEKIHKNPINQAPTKSRPEFKKYLVRDFRFLKVLGKGR